MEKIIRLLIYILVFTTAFIIKSCVVEKEVDSGGTFPGNEEGMAEITFVVDVPQNNQVTTRSQTASGLENTVTDIHILAFDKNTERLITKAKGKNLAVVQGSENNNKISFKATLPIGQEYIFMVLANTGNLLNGIEAGLTPEKDRTDVAALVVSHTGKWNASSPFIPMWGEKKLTLNGSSSPSFELVRMLARVNIEVNLKEISAGVTKDNFRLTSVRYYNYNTAGMLIPGEGNYNFTNNSAIYPSIPGSPGTQTKEALLYNESDITNESYCKEKIYIFEAAHNGATYNTPAHNNDWINNPCLVIGGKYKTSDGTWLNETFYRIDFIRKDNTDPTNIKDIWLSVLRNFSYNVSITEVSGNGFPDPDTALESAPINMEANVLEWNESGMGEIVFDGVFYLSVSREQFFVPQGKCEEEKEENSLYIKTDYIYQNDKNHAQSGWYVEKYVDATDGNTPVTWLKLNPEKGAPDSKVKAWFTFGENTSTESRTAIVWIVAGRLRYPVYVTQRVSSLEIVDPLNNDTPLNKLEFKVPVSGTQAETKQFKVVWTPAGQSVSTSQESPQSWSPFPAEWLSPNPNSNWSITNNTGEQLFEVTAPAVDPQLIQQDPFYERESTYTFTVDDGTGSETKSITLHQIYHNIVVDTYGYRLDGKTHHLSVRSNTEWVITNIEEWLYNENPAQNPQPSPIMLEFKNTDNLKVGAAGGPNIGGESLSFTVVNQAEKLHEKKWGTVYITFESPDNKFAPQTVSILFPARSLTVLGLGYALDVRPYNAAFSTPYHKQGLNRMLTAETNFGYLTESTIKTDPFHIIGYNCQNTPRDTPGKTPDANWYKGVFAKWLNQHNPDIIIVSYSMVFNEEDAILLNQYLVNGGAVIMYYGGDVHNKAAIKHVMDKLLDTNIIQDEIFTGTPEGAVYVLENIDDPVLNGPFGDIRGKNIGTHIAHGGIPEKYLTGKVEILCRMKNMISHNPADRTNQILTFRHKTKNLFWLGNGQGTAAYYPDEIHRTYDPIRNYDDFRPAPRIAFGGSNDANAFNLHNSYLFMNAMAWAMTVTNHTPPSEGY